MASEDVIELGSSDDEAEPVTKKIRPMPNAMVHIPRKIHGVTIKPAKKSVPCVPKELAGKNVTVTKIAKVNVIPNPYALKHKVNGKPNQLKHVATVVSKKPVAQTVQNKPINPLSLMKNINSQVVVNKIPAPTIQRSQVLKNPIRIQSPRSINNLPPSITVTRTTGVPKRTAPSSVTSAGRKKQKLNKPKTTQQEVLTVELDDDDVSATSSPQWYLRPEEQTSILEQENNKEPEPKAASSNLVEITIEDSPVKPPHIMRTHQIGAELPVTIDDSPVKVVVEKNTASGSDNEVTVQNKVPHSKKKLEYPKESQSANEPIEIEIPGVSVIEPTKESESSSKPDKPSANVNKPIVENIIIEIEESPLKVDHGQATSTPKKNHKKPQLEVPESLKQLKDDEHEQVDELSEFHPVYRSFIKLCFQLENSEDMKKIVEKKIKTYYRQVPKEYTESEEFTDMVAGKILSMKASPEKMYLYIKDIVDELNLQRKMAKSQVLATITEKKAETEKFLYGEESEYDLKRQRQIRKLEKTLKKLHRAIQKLEEQEVDFDDDEDSVYLLTESDDGSSSNKDSDKQLEKDPKALLKRYKERMVRVHAKFCQLTNTKMPSEPRVQIDARPGQPSGPAKRLEKWINKKVPIGTPLPFPDFHDVLRCVREANSEDKLGWNEADIMEEARDLFTRCGKKLQRRRQENEWRLAASRISVDIDPAEESTDLKKKLEDNRKVAAKKETEVFNKYADRQSQLKLEAEEIGDKEAEESPVDDDDEDEPKEESLENTEKRKERLKRLLQEKSKKGVSESEKLVIDGTDSQSGNEHAMDQKSDKASHETNDQSGNQPEQEKSETQIQTSDKTNNMDVDIEIIPEKATDASENKSDSKKESVIIQEEIANKEPVCPVNNTKTKNGSENTATENQSAENDLITDDVDKTHLISDDSNKLESDIDELHLLQKLHTETEANTSTQDTSDSESPIAISDTLESSSDNKKHTASDVISIENSSYSESEVNLESIDSKADKETDPLSDKVIAESVDEHTEIECSNTGVEKKLAITNNDEYNESIEDILLASTDDEEENNKNAKLVYEEECVNLKDDTISIGDTVVVGVDKPQSSPTDDNSSGKQDDASSVESVAFVSTKEDSPAEMKDVENTDSTYKENTAQDQNTDAPANDIINAETIEPKESSSEDTINPTTEKSDDSSDCPKKSPEVINNDDKSPNAEHDTVQVQNVGNSNDGSEDKL
ncbi:calponin homology domain-containing protein DDB_G0272472-like isoform X1 [Ostrinia furnacalis]|uniref:calponin homology domain-containing protein DDB_G0272472-like isoform X1 n=1 Tax=Ostrinia furnacalis TaxID=93504 RepID=UPI00103FC282|nr:calponin homology domain-containing protein DDB_G0272472-like isoform X1 [Ostrinia furnacalis]